MGVLRARVGGAWVDIGNAPVDPIWVDPSPPTDPNIEMWYDTDAIGYPPSNVGLEANRPAASASLAGFHYFATDTLNDWLCDGTTWKTNTPTPWTAITTWQNAWVSYGAGYAPQYRKIGDEVIIRGLMKSGAVGTSAFIMPVGFRPAYEESFVELSANAFASISIAVSGVATVTVGTAAPTYFYLSGIRYSTVA